MKTDKEFVPDSIVQEITDRFINRAKFGKEKYGTDLDRTDLSPEQWAQHALEEAHDFMLYVARLKKDLAKQKRLIELLMLEYNMLFMPTEAERRELEELIEWYNDHNS